MSQQPPSGPPPPPPPGAGRGDEPPAWGGADPHGGSRRPAWEGAPPEGPGRPAGQNGPAVGALICGILGLVLFLVPILGLLLAIIGLVLGIVGVRRARDPATRGQGLAIAGIVTGALGTLLGLWWLVGLVGLFTDEDLREGIIQEFEEQMEQQEPQMEDGGR